MVPDLRDSQSQIWCKEKQKVVLDRFDTVAFLALLVEKPVESVPEFPVEVS